MIDILRRHYPKLDEVVFALAHDNVLTETLPGDCHGLRVAENSIIDAETKICLASWPMITAAEAAEILEMSGLWNRESPPSIRRLLWHASMGLAKMGECEEIARQIAFDTTGKNSQSIEWWHDSLGGRNPEYAWHRGAIQMEFDHSVSIGYMDKEKINLYDNVSGLRF